SIDAAGLQQQGTCSLVERGVDRHTGGAVAHREHSHRELRPVGQRDGDTIAAAEPRGGNGQADALDFPQQGPERQRRTAGRQQGERVRIAPRVIRDQPAARARGERGALFRIHAARITLNSVPDNWLSIAGHDLLRTCRTATTRRSPDPASAMNDSASRLDPPEPPGSVALDLESPRPSDAVGRAPTSFSQRRLWLLDRLLPVRSVYNVAHALRMAGELDVDALRRALNELLRRHEVLRTRFVVIAGEPVQEPVPEVAIPLTLEDLCPLAPAERESEARRRTAEEP